MVLHSQKSEKEYERVDIMINIEEINKIIENKKTNIPLLQRNYKWTMECAAELSEDLWEHYFKNNGLPYQLNMITVYNDNDESLQIIDGQQRLITIRLLLKYLKPEENYLNFKFERDKLVPYKKSREYFINDNLKDYLLIVREELSVDIKRLYDNFTAMLVPLSFRSIYKFYLQCLNENINKTSDATDFSFENLFEKVVIPALKTAPQIDSEKIKQQFSEKYNTIKSFCEEYHNYITINKNEDNISDDLILLSKKSFDFQLLWCEIIKNTIPENVSISELCDKSTKNKFADFIMNNIVLLYHETKFEPISEFLNINENKTPFVISDYIRANMICDNPVDGDLDILEKEKNQKNRDDILKIFKNLSAYLYSKEYKTIWELISKGYDNFEKNPDLNRLKILFSDKYIGTSTKDYLYDEEFKRLSYFKNILESLYNEIKEDADRWNTFNAVYILLQCKSNLRFFNLFSIDDIDNKTDIDDVVAKEKFCFFDWAYIHAKESDCIWDISYFLESQLYIDRCKIKKSKNLPEITKNMTEEEEKIEVKDEWVVIDRGNENDELYKCIEKLIAKKQGEKKNG